MIQKFDQVETLLDTTELFCPEPLMLLHSTFKDITEAYEVSRVETLISSIVIFVDEINAYFTIDRDELPGELQFNMDAKVSTAEIPSDAKIKYFMIGW